MSGKSTPLPQLDEKRLKLRDQDCMNCAEWEPRQGPGKGFCLRHKKRTSAGGWCSKWQ